MLSNAYFIAKFRFDTAENEPAKNLQNFFAKLPSAGLPPLQLVTLRVEACPIADDALDAFFDAGGRAANLRAPEFGLTLR